jgi:hypothetical protein
MSKFVEALFFPVADYTEEAAMQWAVEHGFNPNHIELVVNESGDALEKINAILAKQHPKNAKKPYVPVIDIEHGKDKLIAYLQRRAKRGTKGPLAGTLDTALRDTEKVVKKASPTNPASRRVGDSVDLDARINSLIERISTRGQYWQATQRKNEAFDQTTLQDVEIGAGILVRIGEAKEGINGSNVDLCRAVFRFVEEDDSFAVAALMDAAPELAEVATDEGWTLMHEAVERKSATMTTVLIESGVSVSSKDVNNQTPVNLATVRGEAGMVGILQEGWKRETSAV